MSASNDYQCECDEQRGTVDCVDPHNLHPQQSHHDSYAYSCALWHYQMAIWWWNRYNASIGHPQNIDNRVSDTFHRSQTYPTMPHYEHDIRTSANPYSLHENYSNLESCYDHYRTHSSQSHLVKSPNPISKRQHDYRSLQNFKERMNNYDESTDQNDHVHALRSQMETSDVDDDDGGDVDVDDDDIVIEVHEGFRRFLEISEKHRQERRKQKCNQEEDVEYIEVGSVNLRPTTKPPEVQPGVEKAEEMKKLYGEESKKMHSLETALQMHYDLNCDIRHPVYWPSIPLKF